MSTVSSFDYGVDQMQINTELLPGRQRTEVPEFLIFLKKGKVPVMSPQWPARSDAVTEEKDL